MNNIKHYTRVVYKTRLFEVHPVKITEMGTLAWEATYYTVNNNN